MISDRSRNAKLKKHDHLGGLERYNGGYIPHVPPFSTFTVPCAWHHAQRTRMGPPRGVFFHAWPDPGTAPGTVCKENEFPMDSRATLHSNRNAGNCMVTYPFGCKILPKCYHCHNGSWDNEHLGKISPPSEGVTMRLCACL